MHGAALVVHRFWSRLGLRMPAALAWLTTFLFVNFAWVFFRAEDLSGAVRLIHGMLGGNGLGWNGQMADSLAYFHGLATGETRLIVDNLFSPVGAWLCLLLFGLIAFRHRNSIEMLGDRVRYSIVDVVLVGVSLCLVLLLSIASSASVFLYFNF